MKRFPAVRHYCCKTHFFEVYTWKGLCVLTVLGLATLSMAGSDAFAAAVCSNTPGAGNHIQCEEPATSTSDIDIDAVGVDIDLTTSGVLTAGVQAVHAGSGDVDISISGATTNMMTTPSMIDTTGSNTFGVRGTLVGEGTLTFSLEDTEIRTQGTDSIGWRPGIWATAISKWT